MATIIFATFEGGGNAPVVLGIARALRTRGHTVYVMSHAEHRLVSDGEALTFTPYTTAKPWNPRSTGGTLSGICRLTVTLTDRRLGADVVAAAQRHRADLVVVDCMLLGASHALIESGIEHAVLFHSIHSYFNGLFRNGPVGLASRIRGTGDPRRLWSKATSQVVCADHQIDPSTSKTPSNALWVGPIHDARAASRAASTRPRVLISLSTVGYPGLRATLQRIVSACEGLPADFIVTTGPAVAPEALVAPGNTTIHQFLPHDEVMPTCNAVISHGGHSTAMRALAHGLPILAVPMNPLIDQPMVGKAIAAAGAGIVLHRRHSTARFRTAITTLIRAKDLSTSAAEIGHRLRATHSAEVAADHLEQLLPQRTTN